MKQNGGHFEFRMIPVSGHYKTPPNRFSTLKNVILGILIIQIGQLVQKILTYRFLAPAVTVCETEGAMDSTSVFFLPLLLPITL